MIDDEALRSIEKLHKMNQDGIISDADFEKGKESLLAGRSQPKASTKASGRLINKLPRLGVALTICWLVVGGIWSFMRHSYAWRWQRRTSDLICSSETDYSACTERMYNDYHPPIEWLPLILEIGAGLILIWGIIKVSAWIVESDKLNRTA